MKKIFFVTCIFFACFMLPAFSQEKAKIEICYEHDMPLQKRINEIGFKILNANMLDKHVTFSYNSKDVLIKGDEPVFKRQIAVYDKGLKHVENDDELAALLAREISFARKTFDGAMGGLISTAQVKMAPKKYEIVADKRAVDYLVKAGYNPIGLITYINKAYPQARQDKISKRNLTSKRLMYIYERIYYEYPEFLAKNEYINNEYYQNFLLNSLTNRRMLQEAVKNNERGKIKYE